MSKVDLQKEILKKVKLGTKPSDLVKKSVRTIKSSSLPIDKTVFGLLREMKGRKERVAQFINDLANKYSSLKDRTTQFWKDNQTEYDNLTDTSPDNNFKQFFGKFNHEDDIITLLISETQKELEQILTVNSSDDEIAKQLKEITKRDQHVGDLPLFFKDTAGGATWYVFLLDLVKNYYLTFIPTYINEKLTKNGVKLTDLDKDKWTTVLNGLYEDCYSTYTSTDEESDLSELKRELNDDLNNIESLIASSKTIPAPPPPPPNKGDSQNTSNPQLEADYQKLREFARWQTQYIKKLVQIIYGLQQNQPSPQPIIPDNQPKPEPVIKPTPFPQPTPTPGKTDEEIQKEKDAQELQTLKNDISQLPLNDNEKTELINAKNKSEVEQVRTKYNARVNRDQAIKDEIAKYNKISKEIKGETVQTLLEDGKDYDNRIKELVADLLTGKDLSALQTERKNKWQELENKRLAIILQNTKNDALIKDADSNNWDPELTGEEKELINNATDTDGVNKLQVQFKTKRDSVKSATDLLDRLNNWEDITNLPSMANIRDAYDENLVPDELKYSKLKEVRNSIRLKLFKDRFEKPTPTGLKDEEIDKWRDSSDTTGLDGLGTEERTAFLNGWKLEEIKNKKIALYEVKAETNEKVKDIDCLKVNKDKLDTALKILASINDPNKQTFKSLPKDYKKIDINALPNDLPGIASPTNLTARIIARRSTFLLSLNKNDDDAFDQDKYDTITAKIREEYPANEYNSFTSEIANKVLKYNIAKENKTIGKGKDIKLAPIDDLVPNIDEDLDEWLTADEQKGYRIENESKQMIKGTEMTGAKALKQENEWIETNQRDKQGKLLLPFFCAKVGYDPNQPEKFFCEENNSTKGCIPFSTGIGKSTKTMMCLEFIMEQIDKIWKQTDGRRNIVLVLPTEVLASSVANHHNGWLQEYECPIHDIKHGEYKVNKDEIGEGLSILYFPYLLGYVARKFAKTKGSEGGKKFDLSTIKDIQDKLQTIKSENKLKELDPILVFDEADFADGEYRALMEGCVMKGLKVMKMSATFPGVPWSITTSYPLTTKKVDGFKPDHIKPKDKTAIFIRNKLNDEQKKILNDAGVCWVEFDASMAPAVEGITIGMPPGTVFFMTFIYDRGVSMDIKNVIITNWIETTKLGDTSKTGKGFWFYADPTPQKSPIGSLGQQRGRVSRLYPGRCYILVDKDGVLTYEEIKPTDDVGTVFTQAVFSGDTSKIKYGMFQKSLNLTLLSLAWPDKFGLRPEEILVGVQQGGVPPNIFPKFDTKQPSQGCDADLWDKYMKVEKSSEIPKPQAQDILSNMIDNLLLSPNKVNNFPYTVVVEINSPLINRIDWLADKKLVKGKKPEDLPKWVDQDNSKSIKECQKMINGAVNKLLKKLPDYVPDKIQYKNEDVFKKIVDVFKCIDGLDIKIEQEFTDDWIDKKKQELGKKPKSALTLKILYKSSGGGGKRIFWK